MMCILPFVILCLSAIRIKFVKILFVAFMLVGIVVRAKVNSVSSVNCDQLDFL